MLSCAMDLSAAPSVALAAATERPSAVSATIAEWGILWWPIEKAPFWAFGPPPPFFACSARFGKNGDFLAAQPPQRSFDHPVRWYLRCFRARDVQSATLPLVYATPGGSNLPARPKKRPRVPAGPFQNGQFSTPGARFLAFGHVFWDPWEYDHRSLFRVDQNP